MCTYRHAEESHPCTFIFIGWRVAFCGWAEPWSVTLSGSALSGPRGGCSSEGESKQRGHKAKYTVLGGTGKPNWALVSCRAQANTPLSWSEAWRYSPATSQLEQSSRWRSLRQEERNRFNNGRVSNMLTYMILKLLQICSYTNGKW